MKYLHCIYLMALLMCDKRNMAFAPWHRECLRNNSLRNKRNILDRVAMNSGVCSTDTRRVGDSGAAGAKREIANAWRGSGVDQSF